LAGTPASAGLGNKQCSFDLTVSLLATEITKKASSKSAAVSDWHKIEPKEFRREQIKMLWGSPTTNLSCRYSDWVFPITDPSDDSLQSTIILLVWRPSN
jgi:hypothetical protein